MQQDKRINILDELQRVIYGERKESLTPLEINKLFTEPYTPEFNVIIFTAFEKKVLDPDISILQIIIRAKTRECIIPIAFCLRFGADPNMYVNAPKLGTIHILGYIYNTLQPIDNSERDVLNTIALMFVAQGSRGSLPIFDLQSGKIKELTKVVQTTVADWLLEQKYNNTLKNIDVGDATQLSTIIDKESLVLLSILLDKPNLMGREYIPQDMLFAIKNFSDISSNNILLTLTNNKLNIEANKVISENLSKFLDMAVTYYNSSIYEKILGYGIFPSYSLLNKIIIGMKISKNRIIVDKLEKMLIDSISNGVQLDREQLNIISTIGQNTLVSITKEYDIPYWKKICKSNNGDILPEPLRRLAISLNIDPSIGKIAVCDSITSLSKSDKEILMQAAKYRQERRMSANLGYTNEFINEANPMLVCRNKNLLQYDPMTYNDIDLAYYRDNSGVVWCFTSDNFDAILETGVNPYNSTGLPKSFLLELQHKSTVLKNLDKGPTTTFNSAINSLFTKDTILEKSNRIDTLVQLGSQYGVSSTLINSLTKEEMKNALTSIGYNKINLDLLSTSHALNTTSDIIIEIYKVSPNLVAIFFESVRAQRR